MKRYTMEDGFEFLTDEADLIVYTRDGGQGAYDGEMLPIHVIGSVPRWSSEGHGLLDLSAVSRTPRVGDYLVVRGEHPAPPGVCPATISSIDLFFQFPESP